jgi:hypothetical protein
MATGGLHTFARTRASSRVRTVTSRTRRRGGSNTKSVMPRKLANIIAVPVSRGRTLE